LKKLVLVAIAVAAIALGLPQLALAETTQLTQLDYAGFVTVEGAYPLPFRYRFNVPHKSFAVENLSGRLQDEGDSELTIELLRSLKKLASTLTGLTLSSLRGSGAIFSDAEKTIQLSPFEFSYNPVDDILTVDGYDFAKIQSCLSRTCYLAGTAFAVGSLGSLPITTTVEFDVAQTATPIGDRDSLPILG
jgi:hypothetical protein